MCVCVWGGGLNINMSSYQYRDPHVKDKTVSRPIHGKDGLYIETWPSGLNTSIPQTVRGRVRPIFVGKLDHR